MVPRKISGSRNVAITFLIAGIAAVTAAAKGDLSVLLWIAGLCFAISTWFFSRPVNANWKRQVIRVFCTVSIVVLLYALSIRVRDRGRPLAAAMQIATATPSAAEPSQAKGNPAGDAKETRKPSATPKNPSRASSSVLDTPKTGNINQGPNSILQIGGTNNQAFQTVISSPETIRALQIDLEMVCEIRDGYDPQPSHFNLLATTGSGVTLVGLPRRTLLAPRGWATRESTGHNRMKVAQSFSHDELGTILGSSAQDLAALTALKIDPDWSDGNWCSEIQSVHVTMTVNQRALLDGDVPVPPDSKIAEDKPGQKLPTYPHVTVPVRFSR